MSTSRYYTLEVSNAKVTDLWNECLSTKRSKEIFKKNSDFLTELSIDNVTQQIGKAKKATSMLEVEWNGHFPILCSDAFIQLSIRIKVDDHCLGYVELSLDELQHHDKDKETIIFPENKHKSSVTGSISLHLEESDALKVAKLAIENLAQVLRTKDLEKANTFLEQFEAVLPDVDGLVEVIDQLADLHSYLEVVVKILTIPYKGISRQIRFDKEMKDLKASFEKALNTIREVKKIRDPIEYLTANMNRFLDFITQCSIFIQGYVQHTFLGRLVQWRKKGEIEEFKRNLEELMKDIGQAVDLQASVDANITRSLTTDLHELEIDTNSMVKKIHGVMHKDERSKLLEGLKRKLQPITVTGIEANRSRCLDGTRVNELNEIRSWANASLHTDQPNLYLLTGAAGTGKSTIARTVAQEFNNENRLGAYMSFARGESDPRITARAIVNTVIQTVAYHLACHNTIIAESIHAYLSQEREEHFPSMEDLFDNLLHTPLQAVRVQIQSPILIILDALDECGPSDAQRQLVNLLRNKIHTLPPVFRFFITTRPEKDTTPLLTSSHQYCKHQRLTTSKEDVTMFIKYEMEELRDSGSIYVGNESAWNKNTDTLGVAADGLFIWAATAVKRIIEKEGDEERELERLATTRSLSLHDLYSTILRECISRGGEEMRKNLPKVLSLIFFGKERLTEIDINEMLGLEPGRTWKILNLLRSLVVFDPIDRKQPVYLYHISLYDYLTSEEASKEEWFIDANEGKTLISSLCFDVMKSQLEFNICRFETSFKRNEDVPGLEERTKARISPSLGYACRHWASHLSDSPYSDRLSNQLETFALTRLLFWIEVLSLTGKLYACGLSALANTLEWLKDKHPQLSKFLTDARIQLNTFLYPMSQSAPHIYMTFLPVMKETSIVAMHYAKHSSSLSRVEYIGERMQAAYILSIDVGSPVYSISYSRDGSRIASGSKDGVCVWDTETGILLLGPLQNEGATVYSVAFSADGERVVSGDGNGKIIVWNATSGEIVQNQFEGHSNSVKSIAFSPGGEYIASGSDDRTVRVWYSESGAAVAEPWEGKSVSFSPNGRYLASSTNPKMGDILGIINIWGVEKRKLHSRLIGNVDNNHISFSADSKKIVSCSLVGVDIWDVSIGTVVRTFRDFDMFQVSSVVYSRDGKHIMSGGFDGIVRVWDPEGVHIPPKHFMGHTGTINTVSAAPDGTSFASGSGDGTIKMWDAARLEEDVEGHSSKVTAIACSPNGEYVVSGSYDETVCLWRVESGEYVRKYVGRTRAISCVAFSSDNITFASGCWEGLVIIWNIHAEIVRILWNMDRVHSIAFSPDGLNLATLPVKSSSIPVWNIQSGKLAGPVLEADSDSYSIAYSLDGEKIILGSEDSEIYIFSASNAKLLRTLKGDKYGVNSVQFSHDGSHIVSGFNNYGHVIIWDARTGQRSCQIIEEENILEKARSVCFSPDGKWIAFVYPYSGHLYISNVTSGECFFKAHVGSCATSVLFLPMSDSRCINFASVSESGAIRVWSLNVDSEERAWEMDKDGWLTRGDDNLLIWIPKELRRSLMFGPCIRTMNTKFSTKVSLSDHQGQQWTDCFVPFIEDITFAKLHPLPRSLPSPPPRE